MNIVPGPAGGTTAPPGPAAVGKATAKALAMSAALGRAGGTGSAPATAAAMSVAVGGAVTGGRAVVAAKGVALIWFQSKKLTVVSGLKYMPLVRIWIQMLPW